MPFTLALMYWKYCLHWSKYDCNLKVCFAASSQSSGRAKSDPSCGQHSFGNSSLRAHLQAQHMFTQTGISSSSSAMECESPAMSRQLWNTPIKHSGNSSSSTAAAIGMVHVNHHHHRRRTHLTSPTNQAAPFNLYSQTGNRSTQPASSNSSSVSMTMIAPSSSIECTQTGSMNIQLVSCQPSVTYTNDSFPSGLVTTLPSTYVNMQSNFTALGVALPVMNQQPTLSNLVTIDANNAKLTQRQTSSAASASDRDESPMVGVCVQQSPVASHWQMLSF